MQKWTPSDYRRMPWKNGGGFTTEMLIYPADASLDNFVWRLSMAEVNSDGPFSFFPQIDRTLTLLQGAGMVLHHDDGVEPDQRVSLIADSAPYAFAGEVAIRAELVQGGIVDLNMMSRRDVCSHYVQILAEGQHYIQASDAQQLLLFCATGSAAVTSENTHVNLMASETLLLEEQHEHQGIALNLQVPEASKIFVIRIHFLGVGSDQAI